MKVASDALTSWPFHRQSPQRQSVLQNATIILRSMSYTDEYIDVRYVLSIQWSGLLAASSVVEALVWNHMWGFASSKEKKREVAHDAFVQQRWLTQISSAGTWQTCWILCCTVSEEVRLEEQSLRWSFMQPNIRKRRTISRVENSTKSESC